MKKVKNGMDEPLTKRDFLAAMKIVNRRLVGHDRRFEKSDLKFKQIDRRFDKLTVEVVRNGEDIAYLKENMYTKQDHLKFMVWMDDAMKELRDSREGRVLMEKQALRMDDKLDNHEKRICVLEER